MAKSPKKNPRQLDLFITDSNGHHQQAACPPKNAEVRRPNPLVVEIRFYQIAMECGLKGERLERYVTEQLAKNKVPREPEQPSPRRIGHDKM
jgi:hypothetical protein